MTASIRRSDGSAHFGAELEVTIDRGIERRAQDPQPFTPRAGAKAILVERRRTKQVFPNGKGRMLLIEPEDWNRHSKKPAKFRSDAIAINRKK